MCYRIFIGLLLAFGGLQLAAQNVSKAFLSDFVFQETLDTQNIHAQFEHKDLSALWTQTAAHFIFGIIGNDHQRIQMKLITVQQDAVNPLRYSVVGKSKVRGNICDFTGVIEIKVAYALNELHYGVDHTYRDSGLTKMGVLIANYRFDEREDQPHSGFFEGVLLTKWYENKEQEIFYNAIQKESDGYMNNAFVGTWTHFETGDNKICNWGDYRVPDCNEDFDMGAGFFSPSDAYLKNGWSIYRAAILGGGDAIIKEREVWWE